MPTRVEISVDKDAISIGSSCEYFSNSTHSRQVNPTFQRTFCRPEAELTLTMMLLVEACDEKKHQAVLFQDRKIRLVRGSFGNGFGVLTLTILLIVEAHHERTS